MRASLGWALLLAGIALFVMGFHSANSVGTSFSRLFTGAPTNKAIWLLVGGLALSGMGGALIGRRAG